VRSDQLDKPARGPFTPVKQGNLAGLVVSQIKNLIFSKGIDVGQKLPPERDLLIEARRRRSGIQYCTLEGVAAAKRLRTCRRSKSEAVVVPKEERAAWEKDEVEILSTRGGKDGAADFG
jgi:hypothetical protein